MKVVFTMSVEQLKIISHSLNHSFIHDKLFDRNDPAYCDLDTSIQKAIGQIEKAWPATASFKIID